MNGGTAKPALGDVGGRIGKPAFWQIADEIMAH